MERRLEGLRSAPRALRPIRFVSNTLTLNPYRTARTFAQRVDRSVSHGTDAAALEEKSGKRASSTTYQLHERPDRLSLFLFTPTIQFDRESLSKSGDKWG